MKRIIIALIIAITYVLFSLLLAGCIQQESISTPTPTATPSSAIAPTPMSKGTPLRPPLELNASTIKPSYPTGENVEIKFTFKNTGSKSISMSPFPPEIRLMRPRPYEMVRSFSSGSEKLELEPGKENSYVLKWDQKDKGWLQVSPGYYFVDVRDIHVESSEVGSMNFSASTLARVLIQFPQGAMEKTIEVNKSQTRENVTITLERLELSAIGAKVYALARLHNYTSLTPGPSEIPTPTPTPPPDIYPSQAWYRLDNGTEREAGSPGFAWADKDFRLTFDLIDPIPSDAKEMTFVITSFGERAGPWEFQIPLNR